MKKIILLAFIFASCSSTKMTMTTIEELKNKNQVYAVKDNSYYYFMIDGDNNKFLVRTSLINSSKVIWMERLTKK